MMIWNNEGKRKKNLQTVHA